MIKIRTVKFIEEKNYIYNFDKKINKKKINLKKKKKKKKLPTQTHKLSQKINHNINLYTIYILQMNILDSIEASIPACHAGDPGSIPGRGDFFFLNITDCGKIFVMIF